MAVTTRRLTVEQYHALPLDRRHQLIDGEIVVNEPRLRHQNICAWLIHQFMAWTEAGDGRGLATLSVNVDLREGHSYGPDMVWWDHSHAPTADATRFTEPPQLLVEVRSDSTWRFDVGRKKQIYEEAGAPELWLVDTASDSVLAFRRSSADATLFDVALEHARGELLTSPQLPDLTLSVDEVFDR